jgi:tetratricopeptide (TPR) repeat protein
MAGIAIASVTPQELDWYQTFKQAQLASDSGRYTDALNFIRHAAEIADRFDARDNRTWKTYNLLAIIQEQSGLATESIRTYHRAIAMVRDALGKDSADYARLVANLGTIYLGHGNMPSAENLLREALHIQESFPNANPVQVAIIRVRLADVLQQRHRNAEAEQMVQQAFPVLESAGEATDASLAKNTLGLVRRQQRRFAESLDLILQGVGMLEKKVGPDHPLLLRQLNHLAAAYALAGDTAEADATFRRAEAICEKTLPLNHPTRAALLANYAGFLRHIGEKAQAKAMESEARSLIRDSNTRQGVGYTVDVSSFRAR